MREFDLYWTSRMGRHNNKMFALQDQEGILKKSPNIGRLLILKLIFHRQVYKLSRCVGVPLPECAIQYLRCSLTTTRGHASVVNVTESRHWSRVCLSNSVKVGSMSRENFSNFRLIIMPSSRTASQ